MSDLADVVNGFRPWEPSSSARLDIVLHRYDRPLVGIFDQDGVSYLFQCLAGEVEPANFWAYTKIESAQATALAAAVENEFDDLVDRVSAGPAVLVVAVDDRIVASEHVPDLKADQSEVINGLATQAVEVLRSEVHAVREVAAAV